MEIETQTGAADEPSADFAASGSPFTSQSRYMPKARVLQMRHGYHVNGWVLDLDLGFRHWNSDISGRHRHESLARLHLQGFLFRFWILTIKVSDLGLPHVASEGKYSTHGTRLSGKSTTYAWQNNGAVTTPRHSCMSVDYANSNRQTNKRTHVNTATTPCKHDRS